MKHGTISRFALVLAGGWLVLIPPAGADDFESLKSQDPLGVPTGSLRLPPLTPRAPAPVSASAAGSLNVTFVDVGQGDAEFIELPDGRHALIDAGPTKARIAKFLSEHNVTKIDFLVLTHPHSDHYGGMKYVFDATQVDNFIDTEMDNSGAKGDDEVRGKAAAEPGCRVLHPAAGDTLDWGPGVQVRVLNSCPRPAASSAGQDLNDCSITLKLSYGGTSVLFTGDMQSEVEAGLVARYGDGLSAAILKVGHHGSAESSSMDFLNKVRPKLAFIEVGAGNTYGHPTQSALDRLRAVGAEIHRTDQEGTMTTTLGRPALLAAAAPAGL